MEVPAETAEELSEPVWCIRAVAALPKDICVTDFSLKAGPVKQGRPFRLGYRVLFR